MNDELRDLKKFLFVNEPFYFDLLREIELIADASATATASILYSDGVFRLIYNPCFFHSLKPQHQVGLFEHEILHVANSHVTLRAHGKAGLLWNIACDLAVNGLIDRDRLPPGAGHPRNFQLPTQMNAEFYYYYIKSHFQARRFIIADGGTKADSSGKRNLGDLTDSTTNSSPKLTTTRLTDGKTGKCVTMAIQDDHSLWDKITCDEATRMREDIFRLLRDTAQNFHAGKSHGFLPGTIEHLLRSSKRSVLNWRKELRRFVGFDHAQDYEPSFSRPNRRFRMPDVFIPGNVPVHGVKALVALDTSASISDSQMEQFLSEIEALYRMGADITLAQCDAKLQCVAKFKPVQKYSIKGRGGTNFCPVFEYAKTYRFPMVVFLTDGMGTMPGPELARPTLWVLSRKDFKGEKFPFGRITYIESPDR